MKLSWTDRARDDCLYWRTQDRKTLKRINALIADIKRDPDGPGIGKPEILRTTLPGSGHVASTMSIGWCTPSNRTRSRSSRAATTMNETFSSATGRVRDPVARRPVRPLNPTLPLPGPGVRKRMAPS